MKGDNHILAVTTKTVTAEQDPTLAEGEIRVEPLYAFPVQICKATEEIKAKFDIAAPSGAERQMKFVDTATGEICEDADCMRGVRMGDTFRAIPDEAITEVKGQKTNMIVVAGKVPLTEIDFTRAEGRYFVQTPAKGGGAKAYKLLYEGLRTQRTAKGKVTRDALALVAKRTPRTNEKLLAIYADEKLGCLVAIQLCFANALRQPDEQVLAPQTAEVTQAQVEKVVEVLDTLDDGENFIATAKDDNVDRANDLIAKAMEGEAITAPTPIKETVATDDLEALLNASLANTQQGQKALV